MSSPERKEVLCQVEAILDEDDAVVEVVVRSRGRLGMTHRVRARDRMHGEVVLQRCDPDTGEERSPPGILNAEPDAILELITSLVVSRALTAVVHELCVMSRIDSFRLRSEDTW